MDIDHNVKSILLLRPLNVSILQLLGSMRNVDYSHYVWFDAPNLCAANMHPRSMVVARYVNVLEDVR